VSVSADPSASIWEVTRLILDSPGTSPSAIAHAHGFTAVEVAELLPIFLDNLRTDFSGADGFAPELVPPTPRPGESPEEHAERYLRELAESEHLDVVGYDTLGGSRNGAGDDGEDPTFLDAMAEGPAPTAPDEPPGEPLDDMAEFDGEAAAVDAGDQPDPDPHEADPLFDLTEDDPFAPVASPSAAEAGNEDATADDVSAGPDEQVASFPID
jgi:hypothetical protein